MQIRTEHDKKLNIFSTYSIPISLVGLWPLADVTLRSRVQSIFCLLQLLLSGAGAILHLFKTCDDLNDLMESIIVIAFVSMIITKIYSLNAYKEKLAIVLNSAYTDWLTTKNKQDIKVMKDELQSFRQIITLFYGASIPCIILYYCRPFVLGVSAYSENIGNTTITVIPCNYLFPSDYIFDKRNLFFYHVMLFNQMVQVVIMTFINSGTDLMYISIMSHHCGQIEVLIFRMKELGRTSAAEQHFNNIIKRHQQLMNLTYTLEDIFHKIILIQMLSGMMFTCVGGISILINLQNGDTMNLAKSVLLVQFMLLQSYLYTYPADNLANSGEKMLRGIYSSHWYEMPNKLTKNLVFMMMRLNISPSLTVGKFFYLTRRSYTAVIKTGASYLSVLRIFIQRDQI